MSGGTGNDKQYGGGGNDTIFANQGQDESWGGDGNDVLWALSRYDVHGKHDMSGDTLHGGNGNDTFRTRDGERDVIDCGAGYDVAILDRKDVLVDPGACEVVKRKSVSKPSKTDSDTEGTYQSPKSDSITK